MKKTTRKPCAHPLCPAYRAKGSYLCVVHTKAATPSKGHKYGARPKVVDGIRFDSTKEAKRWLELRILERIGLIADLRRQPVFVLHAGTPPMKIGEYRGDFSYTEETRGAVVEDVKSVATRTSMFLWKKKHLFAEHGVTVIEV